MRVKRGKMGLDIIRGGTEGGSLLFLFSAVGVKLLKIYSVRMYIASLGGGQCLGGGVTGRYQPSVLWGFRRRVNY